MLLNPLYYAEFRDIYPLRRSAAFRITEFWPLNRVEKALSDRKEVLCCREAQKKILKKISSIFLIRCATNADCRLAGWQVNEENFVVECFKRVPIPKV